MSESVTPRLLSMEIGQLMPKDVDPSGPIFVTVYSEDKKFVDNYLIKWNSNVKHLKELIGRDIRCDPNYIKLWFNDSRIIDDDVWVSWVVTRYHNELTSFTFVIDDAGSHYNLRKRNQN